MILKFEHFESIRDQYVKYGVDKYYQHFSQDYKNPHIEQIEMSINIICDYVDMSNVLDLSAGGGEVTKFLVKRGFNNVIGSDPYTFDLYQKKTDKKCLKLSFDDIVKGKLNLKFSTIICSFALHLCEYSKLDTLLYRLSTNCNYLVIITPNKRPEINNNYFDMIHNFEIDRVKTRIYKSRIN